MFDTNFYKDRPTMNFRSQEMNI